MRNFYQKYILILWLLAKAAQITGQPAPGDTGLGAAGNPVEHGGGADLNLEIRGWILAGILYIFLCYTPLVISELKKSVIFLKKSGKKP